MSKPNRMKMWASIVVLAGLSVVANANQAPKKTSAEEIQELKHRVEQLEQKVMSLEMSLTELRQPRLLPAR